jgi:hemolysin activation/secretion protein
MLSSIFRLNLVTLFSISSTTLRGCACAFGTLFLINLTAAGSIAQTLPNPDFQRPTPPPTKPLEPILPPSQEILPNTPPPNLPSQPIAPDNSATSIVIKQFKITGNTVLSSADLAQITNRFINKPLDFAQLLQVSSEITQLYVKNGYINSGAYIPGNQSFDAQGGTIEIKVIEGRVEDIVVTGTQRLDPNYIKSRIALKAGPILKIDRLIEGLQLLQLDPLIKTISTELVSGQQPALVSSSSKLVKLPIGKLVSILPIIALLVWVKFKLNSRYRKTISRGLVMASVLFMAKVKVAVCWI